MTTFFVTYEIPGIVTGFPLREQIMAATKEGAISMFNIYYSGNPISANPGPIYDLNGRYSRYFKNKT